MPTCTITCNVSASTISFDSTHLRLLEPRADEFVFELDIDSNESVNFQIGDFAHAGNNYTVTVVTSSGGSSQAWTHASGVATSPTHVAEVDLTFTVTANASAGPPLAGGGRIRILPKGKPD